MRFDKARSIIFSLLVLLILLAACGGSGNEGGVSSSPTLERTIAPTASPSSAPDFVYLFRGSEAAEKIAARVEETIRTLSTTAGNEFIVLPELTESDLEQNPKLVFCLPPDQGVVDLAAQYPEVHFVTIGMHDISEAVNITVIGPEGLGADRVGFIAGVIAAVVTSDWRAGAISVQNSGVEHASNLAFQNGVMFYCGLCRPAYPPFHSYPTGAEVSSSESAEVQGVIDALSNLDVDTIFLSPELSEAASIDMLEASGASYIGGESPGIILGEKWIATVRAAPELAIVEIWNRVNSGESGGTVSMPIIIEDVNTERLTPGREAWVHEILRDLIDGYIDTGVDPITGIAR